MKAAEVLQQMNEIERTVYATQSWWPQLRRLLEQVRAVEEAAQQSVQPTGGQVAANIGQVDLPRACAAGNHYTNDVGRGRDFSFCPDCGKPLM